MDLQGTPFRHAEAVNAEILLEGLKAGVLNDSRGVPVSPAG